MNCNIQLTPHFKLLELTASATARKHGIDNTPPAEAVENLKALCLHTLEPLREALGLPIIITSGYRCKALNDQITHHSTRSQHVTGEAADFWVLRQAKRQSRAIGHTDDTDGTDNRRERLVKAFKTIILDERIGFDQLIIYPTFIHVSYVSSGKNRRKITKGYGNGKYCALSREEALALV